MTEENYAIAMLVVMPVTAYVMIVTLGRIKDRWLK